MQLLPARTLEKDARRGELETHATVAVAANFDGTIIVCSPRRIAVGRQAEEGDGQGTVIAARLAGFLQSELIGVMAT